MRKINKGEPIKEFTDFLNSKPTPSNWDKDFHSLKNAGLSRKCREHILVFEQDCQSGYTEVPISLEDDSHIDHYRKKGIFKNLTFEWNNFVVDILDNNFGACYKDKVVNNPNIYDQIFNPITDRVEDFITFQENGKIIPKSGIDENNKKKVLNTIKIFNLNHKSLKDRRFKLMKIIESYNEFTKDEIMSFLSEYGFRSVILYKLEHMNIQ